MRSLSFSTMHGDKAVSQDRWPTLRRCVFGVIDTSGHANRVAAPALRESAETFLLGAVRRRAEGSVEDNLRLGVRRLRGAGASGAPAHRDAGG
jgi:hypothetical protein